MPWQLTILIHSLLSGTRSVQGRRLGLHKEDVSGYALVVSFFCVSALGMVIAFGFGDGVDHGAARDAWHHLVAGGLLFTSANFLHLKLLRLVPASVAVLMTLLNSFSILLVAWLLIDESLSATQWVGAVLLLSAVFVVQYFSKRNEPTKVRKNVTLGVAIAIIVAVLIGLAIVNEKYLIDQVGLHTYLAYGWGLQFLSSILVFFAMGRRPTIIRDVKVHVNVLLYGLLLAGAGLFFVKTIDSSDSASLTAVSANAKVLVAVVMAYFVLHERKHMVAKFSGLIVGGAGLFLLFS